MQATKLKKPLKLGVPYSFQPLEPGKRLSHDEKLSLAFPAVDAGVVPYGSRVLVQIRTSIIITESGVYIPAEARDTEKWNTQVAKVTALGPLAFCNRDSGKPWNEGIWCAIGEYVRVPKYGGDRWEVPRGSDLEPALFVIFNDLDIIGRVTGDPLTVKAFL